MVHFDTFGFLKLFYSNLSNSAKAFPNLNIFFPVLNLVLFELGQSDLDLPDLNLLEFDLCVNWSS